MGLEGRFENTISLYVQAINLNISGDAASLRHVKNKRIQNPHAINGDAI